MLTISIPSLNPILLEDNLKRILEIIKNNNFELYILDNREDDKIEEIYRKYKLIYSKIHYKKNILEKNFDNNLYNALKFPNTKYVWVIGDGIVIKEETIKYINTILKKDYDFIVVNTLNRLKLKEKEKTYSNKNIFFEDITWHATLLGSTILKKIFIEESLNKVVIDKYKGLGFLHLGILLESISVKKFNGFVTTEEIINTNILKKGSTWSKKPFETFGDNWVKFINNLPVNYSKELKNKVIKSHGDNTGLFTLKGFIKIKANTDEYDFFKIIKNKKKIKKITSTSFILTILIWIIPKWILKNFITIGEIKKRRKINE